MSNKDMPEISVNFWFVKISAKGKDAIRLVRLPVIMVAMAAAMSFAAAAVSVFLGLPLSTHWPNLRAPLAIVEAIRQWMS
jgi:hypothetical protein